MNGFVPELGQLGLSNTPWQQYDLDQRLEDGLCVIGQAIQVARNDDTFGTLVSNSGGDAYEGHVFAMRAYCWCDGDRDGHEDGCPPNFEHFVSGLAVCWYKHVGRGGSMNKRVGGREWFSILRECLAEVLDA